MSYQLRYGQPIAAPLFFVVIAIFFALTVVKRDQKIVADVKDPNFRSRVDNLPISKSVYFAALHGDARSSAEIVDQVDRFCDTLRFDERRFLSCSKASDFWSLVDAENGSTLGMSNVVNAAAESSDCQELVRGIYWTKRLEKLSGDSYDSIRAKINGQLNRCSNSDSDINITF